MWLWLKNIKPNYHLYFFIIWICKIYLTFLQASKIQPNYAKPAAHYSCRFVTRKETSSSAALRPLDSGLTKGLTHSISDIWTRRSRSHSLWRYYNGCELLNSNDPSLGLTSTICLKIRVKLIPWLPREHQRDINWNNWIGNIFNKCIQIIIINEFKLLWNDFYPEKGKET